jgi:hypothetical protein
MYGANTYVGMYICMELIHMYVHIYGANTYVCTYVWSLYICMYFIERSWSQSFDTSNFYNTSVVKIYKATSSLVRFESKNIFICLDETLAL